MNRAQSLRIAGLAGILGVAALRAMVVIEPRVWFDVDPALDAMPLLAMGQGLSHLLDVALLLASALALAGEARAGRGVRWGLVLLALLPAPVIVLQGIGIESGNGFRAGTWLAAMLAFVAVGHLVREQRLRVVVVSVLSALMVALALRGMVQVFVEHPATVAMYRETREAFLANRGWAADSSAALTYERRLMQPEATGWFGLSNPYSTMMGVGAIALGALAILARRAQQSGNTLLLALGSAACATLLAINLGKGAIAATLLAAALLVYLARSRRVPSARLALALVAAVLAAVLARGLVGTRIGELSLLLRSFYMQAGWGILSHGDAALFGVGADGVQEAFASTKPAICPEDVQSLHSIFADWIVAIGVVGFGWIALVFSVFWHPLAVAQGDAPDDADDDAPDTRRVAFAIALGAGVVALVVEMYAELPIVDTMWFMARALGVVAFAAFAAVASDACKAIGARALAVIAFALAVLVLVHAQIEMVAWTPGSCVLALCLMGAGSAVGESSQSPRAGRVRLVREVSQMLGIVAAIFLAGSCVRAFVREKRVAEAAAVLTPLVDERAADDGKSADFRTREAARRMQAVETLSQPDWISSRWMYEAAVRQACAAAVAAPSESSVALARAWSIANGRGMRGALSPLLAADVAMLRLRLGERSPDALRECLRAVERAAATHPANPRRAIDLGMMLEANGDRAGASDAYARALDISTKLSLDPLAQLSDREIASIRTAKARLSVPSDPQR